MKKILLLLLIGLANVCFAQQDVTSFYSVPFGSTKAEVILLMKEKGYILKPSASKYLTFEKIRYGLRTAHSASFYFYNNKLYKGLILFLPELESKILNTYTGIAEELTEKYGDGESTEDYTTPFEKGDGYFLTALKTDKLQINTEWIKPSGSIELSIAPSTLISISYQDRKLANQAYNEQKTKTNNDL